MKLKYLLFLSSISSAGVASSCLADGCTRWWNDGWPYRASLEITEVSGRAGKNSPAALRDFHLLNTIIKGAVTVVDDTGAPVRAAVASYPDGHAWLWLIVRSLPANGNLRYYVYWGGKVEPAAKISVAPGGPKGRGAEETPGEVGMGEDEDDEDLFGDIAKADDFSEGSLPPELAQVVGTALDPIPSVRLGPPEGPAWWKVGDGVYRQERADRNVMAFAGSQSWGDYEFTVRIKPAGARSAGVLFRVADPRSDSQRYYWLVSSTRDGREGSSNVWCGYRHGGRGDSLVSGQWNTLRVKCEGGSFSLSVNGKIQKQFDDTDQPLLRGGIGLATFGGAAWFDDVKVTAIPSGETLFADDFADGCDEGWTSFAHRMRPVFVSIVNRLKTPAFFHTPVNFHHDPWKWKSLHVSKLGLTESQPAQEHWLAPGERSPWAHIGERMSARSHSTLTVIARTSRFGSSPIRARIDIAPQPDLASVTRSFDYTSDTPRFTAEFHPIDLALTPNFYTVEEIAQGTLATVNSFPEKGRRPRKFRVGSPGYLYGSTAKALET